MGSEKTDFEKREVLDPGTIRSGLSGFQGSYRVFPLYTDTLVEKHLGSWFAGVMGTVNSTTEYRMIFEIWTGEQRGDRPELFVCLLWLGPGRFVSYTEDHPEKLKRSIENDENLIIPRFSSLPELKMKLGLSGV